ncbi:MAG: carbon-nitrogen hydrolase family protein [Clostridia bacterium]|nr:carbon-nitrogen hydrolase family protein [Clostridia bacterium]
MIFCFSDIDFDDVVEDYGALISPNDTVILSREITGVVDMPAEFNGNSHIFRDMIVFSKDKEIILIVSMRAKIGDRLYNSVMLIDGGKVFGVSDEIYPIKGYEKGSVVRSYLTSRGKICIFVDSDICYPQLWQSCFENCRYIFSMNSIPINRERITCAKTLARVSGKHVLAQFCDASVSINCYGRIESIKLGRMSAFYLPLSLTKGRILDRKIKFVEERGD